MTEERSQLRVRRERDAAQHDLALAGLVLDGEESVEQALTDVGRAVVTKAARTHARLVELEATLKDVRRLDTEVATLRGRLDELGVVHQEALARVAVLEKENTELAATAAVRGAAEMAELRAQVALVQDVLGVNLASETARGDLYTLGLHAREVPTLRSQLHSAELSLTRAEEAHRQEVATLTADNVALLEHLHKDAAAKVREEGRLHGQREGLERAALICMDAARAWDMRDSAPLALQAAATQLRELQPGPRLVTEAEVSWAVEQVLAVSSEASKSFTAGARAVLTRLTGKEQP